ncbi:MAG TPA: hypothetical protein VHX52_13810 [Steroidobacteraceae bacterium]|jgi:hypothetical protein|nr:hypothetical protein [Steroidobacteraceae bacterium]
MNAQTQPSSPRDTDRDTRRDTQRDTSGIDGRAIAAAALGVLLLIAMAAALVRLLSASNGTTTSAALSTGVQVPRLSRTDSTRELMQYQVTEAAWLDGYGWLDHSHTYAHIPIERAMQLLVQQPQQSPAPDRPP